MDIPALSALTAVCILAALSVFQIALIAGAPIAKYAWGGSHDILPTRLRVSSAISIFLYLTFAVFILSKSNIVNVINNPAIVNGGIWVITGYFILGVALNALSRSKAERSVMTPVALVLAIAYLIVSLS